MGLEGADVGQPAFERWRTLFRCSDLVPVSAFICKYCPDSDPWRIGLVTKIAEEDVAENTLRDAQLAGRTGLPFLTRICNLRSLFIRY